jgi:hypothetical protein
MRPLLLVRPMRPPFLEWKCDLIRGMNFGWSGLLREGNTVFGNQFYWQWNEKNRQFKIQSENLRKRGKIDTQA